MSRTPRVIILVVVAFALGLGAAGCHGARTILRGQSPGPDDDRVGVTAVRSC
jgi:hypothetical protein